MPDRNDIVLESSGLDICVPARQLVRGLDVAFSRGEVIAVLGPNGVGKTLTLLTLAGLRAPNAGHVSLLGTDIAGLRRAAIAPALALMPQSVDDIFPATVLDTALIGRHPHIGALQWESQVDRDKARDALRVMGIDALMDRDVLTLSGGERRRLAVAQILAQEPDVYLLDEPTNHLDPQHQLDVLATFRSLADQGSTVIASLHDVNLAARFADRCLLLYGDGRWDVGSVGATLSEERLSALYGTRIEAVPWRTSRLYVAVGGAPPG